MRAHLICDVCWKRLPDPKPIPVAVSFLEVVDAQPCCWCGEPTQAGVYYTHYDPQLLACKGTGPIHEEAPSEQLGHTPSVTIAGQSESQTDSQQG